LSFLNLLLVSLLAPAELYNHFYNRYH
jgi:hypothetical protein